MGAKFESQAFSWRRSVEKLEIRQRVGSIDTGVVTLAPETWGRTLIEEGRNKAKAAAKKL